MKRLLILWMLFLSACEGGGSSSSGGVNFAPTGSTVRYQSTTDSDWFEVTTNGAISIMFESCEVRFLSWTHQDVEPGASRFLMESRADNCALQFDSAGHRSIFNYVPAWNGVEKCVKAGMGLSGTAKEFCRN